MGETCEGHIDRSSHQQCHPRRWHHFIAQHLERILQDTVCMLALGAGGSARNEDILVSEQLLTSLFFAEHAKWKLCAAAVAAHSASARPAGGQWDMQRQFLH